jgi:hypothetical protein
MVALILLALNLVVAVVKSKSGLEAENAALRQQLIVLRRQESHARTRMIVFPLRRSVGFRAATASSRVETLPMFVRSRPSRTRWTISLS